MNSSNSISNPSYLSWLQQTTNLNQQVGVRSTGVTGNSNFLKEIKLALEQTSSGNSTTRSLTDEHSSVSTSAILSASLLQAPEAAAQTFLQNLFSALGQGIEITASSARTTIADNVAPATGIVGNPAATNAEHAQSENTVSASDVHNLLQQLADGNHISSAGSQTNSANLLNNLDASFQNLIDSMNTAKRFGTPASSAPTLQLFLQNLYQNMGSENEVGPVVNIQV